MRYRRIGIGHDEYVGLSMFSPVKPANNELVEELPKIFSDMKFLAITVVPKCNVKQRVDPSMLLLLPPSSD